VANRGTRTAGHELPTIGYLRSATLATESQRMAAFVQRLRELGRIEGRTVVIDCRGTHRAICRDRGRICPAQGRCHCYGGRRGRGRKAGNRNNPHRVRGCRGPSRVAPAFEALKGAAQALFVCPDATINANHARINTLALGARLPTMHGLREIVPRKILHSACSRRVALAPDRFKQLKGGPRGPEKKARA
jgi:hypothetical protein